jgi:chorismate dehydratase
MNKKEATKVRIGMANYLNTAPIYEKLKSSAARNGWQLVEAPPAHLTQILAQGDIDIGFISACAYAADPENYKILSGLSISDCGSSGSVFLLSHVPLLQLDLQPLLLSSQAETSLGLLKIVLEVFNKVKPSYLRANEGADDQGCKAVLVTGDEAISLVQGSTHLYQFDLGDLWKQETSLPLVLGICVVREDFCEKHPDLLASVHEELLRCRDEGISELDIICEKSAVRVPLSAAKCRQYLEAMEYDLGGQKRKALETFFGFLIKRGDIAENALPLRMYTSAM